MPEFLLLNGEVLRVRVTSEITLLDGHLAANLASRALPLENLKLSSVLRLFRGAILDRIWLKCLSVKMNNKSVRHVLGISGGKKSAALTIHMRDKVPEMEYFATATEAELPDV